MAAVLAGGIAPARSETRALLVGINEYRDAPLAGAVNDARTLAASLTAAGAGDVRLLTDTDASLPRLRQELRALTDRTRPGDLVIIAFSGHGAREPWGADHPPDVSEGELHEVFLLQDYRPLPKAGTPSPARLAQYADRFSGREMQDWLRAFAAQKARTLFIADTCHGGGLTREPFDAGVRRFASRGPIDASADVAVPPAGAADPRAFAHFQSLPGVTFLGAANAAYRIDEIAVGQTPETIHGAMSFAAAQALTGAADGDGDGRITRRELYQHLRAKVRALTKDRQNPELQPSEIVPGYSSDEVVIDLARDLPKASRGSLVASAAGAAPTGGASRGAGLPSGAVRLATRGDVPDPMVGAGPEVEAVADARKADLIFDPGAGQVITAEGDLLVSEISRADLPGIIEREAAWRRLAALAEARPWELRLLGPPAVRRYGEVVRLDARSNDPADSAPRRYLLLAMSGIGEVHVLAPQQGGDAALSGLTAPPELEVGPPYGADLAIALVSEASLADLARALEPLNGHRRALDAARLIEQRAKAGDLRIGIAGIYTAP